MEQHHIDQKTWIWRHDMFCTDTTAIFKFKANTSQRQPLAAAPGHIEHHLPLFPSRHGVTSLHITPIYTPPLWASPSPDLACLALTAIGAHGHFRVCHFAAVASLPLLGYAVAELNHFVLATAEQIAKQINELRKLSSSWHCNTDFKTEFWRGSDREHFECELGSQYLAQILPPPQSIFYFPIQNHVSPLSCPHFRI